MPAAALPTGAQLTAGAQHPVPGRRRALLALGALPLAAGCTMVEGLFFHPDALPYSRPSQFGLVHEDVFIDAPDGSRLHAWWLPAASRPALGTVLHLHGNAANVSNHLPLVADLPRAGFNLLMLDYRGFGRSTGKATLDGVVEDARAALAWLRTRPEVERERLAVYGHSLGGATALRLLAVDRAGVKLGVIESAFASYRQIARDAASGSLLLAPLLPLALPALPGPERDPVTALAQIDTPLLFIHGTADSIVPLAHSERLLAAAREPRRLLRVEGAMHMQAGVRPDVRAELLQALRAALR